MDTEYGRQYRRLYERHWWWRAREAAIAEVLQGLRPAGGWPRILDVGCGDGLFFNRLTEFGSTIEGVEPSAELVSDDPARRGRIYVQPFDESFHPSAPFGLIVMLDVVEHLTEPEAALRHALSILAPNGTILITVPAFRALWTRHDDLNHHVTRFTRTSFGGLARRSGLAIARAEYFFHWTFPVKLAQRAAERIVRRDPAPPVVPPAAINAALLALSRAERVLPPLPFGSSLMIVAGHPTARHTAR